MYGMLEVMLVQQYEQHKIRSRMCSLDRMEVARCFKLHMPANGFFGIIVEQVLGWRTPHFHG
jgi:hypothetical protein